MEKIKLLQSNNIFDANITYIKSDVYKIELENNDVVDFIEFSSGFQTLNEYNGSVMAEYRDYTIKYKDSAEDEKNVFYISNGEIYVEPTPVEPEEPTPPIPEMELTEEEKAALKEQEFLNAKSYKIDEMSNACEKAIENGIIVGGKAYSYTVQDQSNMLSIVNMARETGMEVPYHANGETCALYDYSSIAAIYMEEQMNLMRNQTYFNQLKLYINSITDVNELDTVNGIYYGTELQGEYLDTYNKIIAQSEQIMSKLVLIEARSL